MNDAVDLMARLRKRAAAWEATQVRVRKETCLEWEAAEEIARLKARIAELEKEVEKDNAELDHAHKLVAELEEAQRWRPMSEAPKDGTIILAFATGNGAQRVQWERDCDGNYDWYDASSGDYWPACDLNCWLPLPTPPED